MKRSKIKLRFWQYIGARLIFDDDFRSNEALMPFKTLAYQFLEEVDGVLLFLNMKDHTKNSLNYWFKIIESTVLENKPVVYVIGNYFETSDKLEISFVKEIIFKWEVKFKQKISFHLVPWVEKKSKDKMFDIPSFTNVINKMKSDLLIRGIYYDQAKSIFKVPIVGYPPFATKINLLSDYLGIHSAKAFFDSKCLIADESGVLILEKSL